MENGLFIQKSEAFIKRYNLLTPKDKVLIALSGGADSVALLFTLHSLGYECIVAHCNFHLRGEESMRDEYFVRNLCERINIPYYIEDFDVRNYCISNSVSTEMAARELRYNWFEVKRKELGCAKIAVAHHHDDNVETFFLNLLRGSGISGLAAIKPLNGYIIRPLLQFTRVEIEKFLSNRKEDFVIDSTNAQNDYKRNRIRNIIIPAIKEQFPDADTTISRTIKNLYSCNIVFQTAIEQYKIEFWKELSPCCYRIDIKGLQSMPGFSAILYELIKEYGFNSFQVEEIIEAYKVAHTGARFESKEYLAILNRKFLDISLNITYDESFIPPFQCISGKISSPINLKIEVLPNVNINLKTSPNIAYFSEELLHKEFNLRHWMAGDKLAPFGLNGKKKLSDVFSDLKLSKIEKDSAWLLMLGEEILWIIDIRRSRHYLPKEGDNKVIKIEYIR